MIILSHRGYWKKSEEKNTLQSIKKALVQGYGFESDIRDYKQKLVISHNIADEESPDAETVFKMLHEYGDKYCFAINVKADGLKEPLQEVIEKYNIKNYFTFDMSVPQMVEYYKQGITFFTRQSEYERQPIMLDESAGVWVDAFQDDSWIDKNTIMRYLEMGKKVCIVSPDLHGKETQPFWKQLKEFQIDSDSLMLCTDKPDEAKDFFMKMRKSNGD